MCILCFTWFNLGDLGRSFVTELIVGRSATYNNTIMDSVSCFNYSHSEDDVKEGLEMVYLTLNTSDSGVCLGRDLAFVNVPPNGGMQISAYDRL